MAGDQDRDLTGQDPLSSAAEGDDDAGSAALAAEAPDDAVEEPSFSDVGPPPEAADETPVSDAVPGSSLEEPDPTG